MRPVLRLLSAAPKQAIHKAKRPWPPDFSRLTQHDQFRLERRYRRRAQRKYERPTLQKVLSIVQWGTCGGVLVYAVLFAKWEQENHVFMPIRKWFFGLTDSFWTSNAGTAPRSSEAERK